jgi:beta-glucanase (GH16 family)
MMLLVFSMMAQIDLNDKNWRCVVNEQFDEGAQYWQWDTARFLNKGDYSWKASLSTIAPKREHEIYQFGNCRINTTDNTMHLVAYYDSVNIQKNNYYLPKWMLPENGGKGYPAKDKRLYFSGAIEYYKKHYVKDEDERKFRYGYFEIRCKIPVHQGAFPAFWLQSSSKAPNDKYYEEIDIFEYSWWITSPSGDNPNPPGLGSKRCFTCGLYFNDKDTSYRNHSYARVYPLIPSQSSDLDQYHTFGCEWMPDHVIWYFDDQVVNEYDEKENIPHRPLYLKANYAINSYYNHDGKWLGPGEMVIDHIKAYQLKWDCNKNEKITSQSDLKHFDYAVKKSIAITSKAGKPVVESGDKVTFRVTDSFEITGPFEVKDGAEFTVIMQSCPSTK